LYLALAVWVVVGSLAGRGCIRDSDEEAIQGQAIATPFAGFSCPLIADIVLRSSAASE
jgi:hypothetical protein